MHARNGVRFVAVGKEGSVDGNEMLKRISLVLDTMRYSNGMMRSPSEMGT